MSRTRARPAPTTARFVPSRWSKPASGSSRRLPSSSSKRGLRELSLPRAAQRARVSVPTIYRHFSTKEALMQELTDWVDRKLKLSEVPESIDEFTEYMPRFFAYLDENEPLVRTCPAALEGSSTDPPRHEASSRQAGREGDGRRDRATRPTRRATRVCGGARVHANSGAWEMMRVNWNLTGEQAGRRSPGRYASWSTSL